MTQENGPHLNKPSDLDPTDDHFDKKYLSILELMSSQASAAIPEDPGADHEAESTTDNLSTDTTEGQKSVSISPDVLQAILDWKCSSQSA